MVGAAAAVAPCGSLMRDGLLWRPKGLLSVQFALSGSYALMHATESLPSAGLKQLTRLCGPDHRNQENGSQGVLEC
jgi:hypothetical protein